MERFFDLSVGVAKRAWPGFLVVMTLWLSGVATPGGMFDWAIDSFKYGVVGWAAGWPVVGARVAQVIDLAVAVFAVTFFWNVIAGVFAWVISFFEGMFRSAPPAAPAE